jgi:energy-coupling factor transporter ATP-binding protein EcfA2
MISIDTVSFTYQGAARPALDKVSLQVSEGDFLGIVGPSGSGKSTLAFAVCGAIPHCYRGDFYGSVTVDGKDTFETALTDIARTVGTVLQDVDAQMVATVVEDEVLFGLENFGVPADQIEGRLVEALEEVGIADLRMRAISSLSGGQKQKVALAAILALRPRVLVLDEPTGALDPAAARRVFEALRKLNRHGITVIVIEQNVDMLATYAHHLAVMDAGGIVASGDARDVLVQTDVLQRLGIALPPVVGLSAALHGAGLTDGEFCVNVEEAQALLKEMIV